MLRFNTSLHRLFDLLCTLILGRQPPGGPRKNQKQEVGPRKFLSWFIGKNLNG